MLEVQTSSSSSKRETTQDGSSGHDIMEITIPKTLWMYGMVNVVAYAESYMYTRM